MNDEEAKQLEQLLTDKKLDEAKTLLQAIFARPLTELERGALYTEMITIYMKTMGALDQQYIHGLEEVMSGLDQADRTEVVLEDKISLAALRKDLQK